MKIRYKQYIIEEDTYGYMLSEMGVTKKGNNIWVETTLNVCYPKNFERACLIIQENLRSASVAEELGEYVKEYKEITEEFKNFIKNL